MRAEGVQTGVPDLFLAWPGDKSLGLFIEMKSEKGRLTTRQVDQIEILRKAGYRCEICHSLDEFTGVMNEYLKTN